MEWRPPLLCAYPLGHRVLATLKKCEKCRKGLVETHARCTTRCARCVCFPPWVCPPLGGGGGGGLGIGRGGGGGGGALTSPFSFCALCCCRQCTRDIAQSSFGGGLGIGRAGWGGGGQAHSSRGAGARRRSPPPPPLRNVVAIGSWAEGWWCPGPPHRTAARSVPSVTTPPVPPPKHNPLVCAVLQLCPPPVPGLSPGPGRTPVLPRHPLIASRTESAPGLWPTFCFGIGCGRLF